MNIRHFVIPLSGALPHWGAWAHDGHGLTSLTHWHATDTLGFILVAALLALVWALSKRK